MRISFIKNKLNNRIENGDNIIKNYKSSKILNNTRIKYFGIIFLTELIIALFICYISCNSIFDIDVYSSYYFNRLSSIDIDKEKYFCFIFLEQAKEYFVLILINITPYKNIGNYIFVIYKITQITCGLCIFILKFGIIGQLVFLITVFPQGIIIGLYICLVIKFNTKRIIRNKGELLSSLGINIFMMLICIFIASILEAYVNTELIYKTIF